MTSQGDGIPAADGAELVRMDPITGEVTQLTDAAASDSSAQSPSWSPDGQRIAFVRGALHQPDVLAGIYDVYVMDADGSRPQPVTNGTNAQTPTWSPDGARIAFVRDQGAAISVVDLPTGSVEDLYVPPPGDVVQVPVWSPDGSRIAFQMGSDSVDVYTLDLSTHELTRLTDDGSGSPAWSPDGSRIAFRRGDNIWVMTANGDDPERITTCALPCVGTSAPAWSPDGTTLVFVLQGDGGRSFHLFEIGVDGSGLRALTSGSTMYSHPSWRPSNPD